MSPSPRLGPTTSGAGGTSRLAALSSTHSGARSGHELWTAERPRSGEGCCHLLEEDNGQKRRAAQGQSQELSCELDSRNHSLLQATFGSLVCAGQAPAR